MFVANKKKNSICILFLLPFFFGIIFFAKSNPVYAAGCSWMTTNMFTGECSKEGEAMQGALETVTNVGGKVVSTGVSWAAQPFLWVFNALLLAVYTILGGGIMILAAVLLDWAINPTNFTIVVTNDAVYQSWQFIRDILNIFFIAFLLFTAFATVFQIEKYNYKKVVLHLVIMALLVNFSFPIARFIIDVSNVLFYGILSLGGFKGGGFSASIANAFNVWTIAFPSTGLVENLLNAQSVTAKLIFAIIFLFITAMTFLIIGMLFVIRIAVLTLLIIFSPVGFVASIFPGTKQLSDKWWSFLINQSFFAPIMALVLVVALNVMNLMNSQGKLKASIEAATNGQSVLGDYSPLITGAMTIVIPLTILWVGLGAAKMFGAIGADIVMKYAGQGRDLLAKKAWGGAKWGGRKIDTKLAGSEGWTRALSPSVIGGTWESWRTKNKKRDEDTIKLATGKTHTWINEKISEMDEKLKGKSSRLHKMFSPYNFIHKDRTDHGHLTESKIAKEYEDEIKARGAGNISEDVAVQMLKEAVEEGEAENAVGAFTALAKTNGLERIAESFWNDRRLFSEEESNKMKEKFKGRDSISLQKQYPVVMRKILEKLGMGREQINKHTYNLDEIAKANGDYAMADNVSFNFETGKFDQLEGVERDRAIASTVAKVRVQKLGESFHGRGLHEQRSFVDEEGLKHKQRGWGDVHSAGAAIAAKVFTSNTLNSFSRMRPDLEESVKEVVSDAQDERYKNDYPVLNKLLEKKDGNYRAFVTKVIDGKSEEKKKEDSSGSGSGKSEADKKEAERKHEEAHPRPEGFTRY